MAKRLRNLAELSTNSWCCRHGNCIQDLPKSRIPSKQLRLLFGTLSQDDPEIEKFPQGLKSKIKYFQISVPSLPEVKVKSLWGGI